MDKYLGKYKLPKLTHEEVDNFNHSTGINEFKSVNYCAISPPHQEGRKGKYPEMMG